MSGCTTSLAPVATWKSDNTAAYLRRAVGVGLHPRHLTEACVRIAISGSHATGKSTLARALAEHLVTYEAIEEPYYLLEAAGHAFSHPPRDDDFVALLDCSASLYFRYAAADIVFDRSPADYLAYLAAGFADSIRPEYLAATVDALATLDLVVLTPIERQ